jgi:uncharacterized membrane protein
MTDAAQPAAVTPPPPAAPPAIPDSDRQMAIVIYILYLIPAGITHIVGLILAYVNREGASEALRSHYTLQIRTFWIGLLYFFASALLCFVLIGFPLLCAVTVWFYVRLVLGLSRLTRGEAYPTPENWLI